jgi:hypothetical protein
MSKYESLAALRGKIEWEDGILGAIDYGITEHDMPCVDEDNPTEDEQRLYDLWAEARTLMPIIEEIDELIGWPNE